MTATTRVERDSMGPLDVPAHALWGAQTQRAIQNFPPTGLRMPRMFIRALALIKHAAAGANAELADLPAPLARAIQEAVPAADPLDASGDRALPACFLGDVQGHEQRRVAQFACERTTLGLLAVGQHGFAALAGCHRAGQHGAARHRGDDEADRAPDPHPAVIDAILAHRGEGDAVAQWHQRRLRRRRHHGQHQEKRDGRRQASRHAPGDEPRDQGIERVADEHADHNRDEQGARELKRQDYGNGRDGVIVLQGVTAPRTQYAR